MLPLIVATAFLGPSLQVNQVVSRRIVFETPAAIRGRVNAIYMTATFLGGAAGSLLGTVSYDGGGWTLTTGIGVAVGAALLGLLALEQRTLPGRTAVGDT